MVKLCRPPGKKEARPSNNARDLDLLAEWRSILFELGPTA